MAMLSTLVSSSRRMRSRRKWPLSPYKGKWQHCFSELQAMETLKKKVEEEPPSSTDLLSILINSFHAYGLKPSPSAYSFIIGNIFHRHLFSHLPPILDHLEKAEKFEVAERIFIDIIQNYSKADMIQDAVNIFFRIPKFRCTPSVLSLNSLLSVLCKKREGLMLVQDVLMKAPGMNIRLEASSFRILVKALCRNGRVGFAIELIHMMEQLYEFEPDSTMYSLVLCSLCKQAGSIEVMDFLEELRNAGFLLNALEYTGVINVLARDGKANDAYAVLTQMKLEGRKPDIVSYTSVLDGFVMARDFHKVDEVFDEMLVMGLVPDAFTYNTYINGLCKQGDFERACRMIILMEKTGCNPDIVTYNTLIAGYCRAGEMAKAREAMSEMIKKGLHGSSHTYRVLIHGWLSEGKVVEACGVLMEMLSRGFVPLPSAFNALICGFCEKGLFCEVIQVLKEMISRSIAPDASSWEALLVGFKWSYQETSTNLENIILEASPR